MPPLESLRAAHSQEDVMGEDYIRGEMDISGHRRTFDGVIGMSVFASLLTVVIVLYLTLVFGADFGWFNALIATAVVGGAGGYVTKQSIGYWITLVVFGFIALVAGVAIGALG
jgi:hypothetical protein